MLWLKYKRHLDVSSFYLRDLERDKWPALIGLRDTEKKHKGRYAYKNYWVSWQHYHDRHDVMPSILIGGVVVIAIWAFGLVFLILGLVLPPSQKIPEARIYLCFLDSLAITRGRLDRTLQ
jgi:hypothetical protein